MNASRLKKQLWRRWRRWKKAPWVVGAVLAAGVIAWSAVVLPGRMTRLLSAVPSAADPAFRTALESGFADNALPVFHSAAEQKMQAAGPSGDEDPRNGTTGIISLHDLRHVVQSAGVPRVVHLKTTYLCGEEIVTFSGKKTPGELGELIDRHPEAAAWIGRGGDVWLSERVDDLSPDCKRDAYIGVNGQGQLSLFKGPPEQEEVIRTFFQMDMGSMKSSLPEEVWKELQRGIRVKDADEYNSVLSTFSDYAVGRGEHM